MLGERYSSGNELGESRRDVRRLLFRVADPHPLADDLGQIVEVRELRAQKFQERLHAQSSIRQPSLQIDYRPFGRAELFGAALELRFLIGFAVCFMVFFFALLFGSVFRPSTKEPAEEGGPWE
jgi:hypothetical protein